MAELSYELSFKGVASDTLRAAFEPFEPIAGGGVTRVRCPHGEVGTVIARIEELGLVLLDVHLLADQSADQRAVSPGAGEAIAP
jgi:hypothetical protein